MIVMDKNTEKVELLDLIRKKSAVVGIIGLGYVGLPLASHFYKKGFRTLGFDVDAKKIDQLLHGKSYIQHLSETQLREMIDKKRFEATIDFDRLKECDCLIICVPTPLKEKMQPDLSYLLETTKTILRKLRPGQLIVLESTSYPGTTEEILLPQLESAGMKVGRDFFLAFSPEREDPGNGKFNAGNIPKVVSGVTDDCKVVASALYSSITKVVPVSSTRVAEMTKLLENIFRGVNIALVNEMKVLSHKMGIDIFEVIDAAATKPFGFMPFYPGPGLGGHCIPIDPFYLSWKAKEYNFTTRFIQLAGEINIAMPDYVVKRTIEALNQRRKSLNGSRVLILGIAYKKDVDDDRESPGYKIMESLLKQGAEVSYNDPFIPKLKPTRKFNFQKESILIVPEVLQNTDAVIVVTDHRIYDFEQIVKHAPLIIDTRNATRGIIEGREKIILA